MVIDGFESTAQSDKRKPKLFTSSQVIGFSLIAFLSCLCGFFILYQMFVYPPTYIGEFTNEEIDNFIDITYANVPCIVIGRKGKNNTVYVNTSRTCRNSISGTINTNDFDRVKIITRNEKGNITTIFHSPLTKPPVKEVEEEEEVILVAEVEEN